MGGSMKCVHDTIAANRVGLTCVPCGQALGLCKFCERVDAIDACGFMGMHFDRLGDVCFGTGSVPAGPDA